ncbi:hypothetical protein Q8F55_007670 [Vanrija albida]|uniref:F-box domain-containing protein n=1 Tax=Vanrija albida TaxID=181172 RepID=A0ABR3PU71_9TREE
MSRPRRTAVKKQAPHKSKAATKRQTRKAKPTGKPQPVLDTTAYPHLLDEIITYAPYEALLSLRQTSRAVRKRVDRSLYRHIMLVREDQHLMGDELDDIDDDALILVASPEELWKSDECLPGFVKTEAYQYMERLDTLHDTELRDTGPRTRAQTAMKEEREADEEEYAHEKAYFAHTKILDVAATHGAFLMWLAHLHPDPFPVVRTYCDTAGFYQSNPVPLGDTLVVMPPTQPSSFPMPSQQVVLRWFPRRTKRVIHHVKMPLLDEDPIITFRPIPVLTGDGLGLVAPEQQVFVFSDASPNLVAKGVERAKRVLAAKAGHSVERRWQHLAAEIAPNVRMGGQVLMVDFHLIDPDWFQFDADSTPAQRQENFRLRILGEMLGDSEEQGAMEDYFREPMENEGEALELLDKWLVFKTRAEWEAGLTEEEVELFAVDDLAKRNLEGARVLQGHEDPVLDLIISSIDFAADDGPGQMFFQGEELGSDDDDPDFEM